ncbi:GDP-mannose mannosyl hydrolase [Rheinheimera riviphila]|uniref:GDP-mannose mannosyl hydrolase n=1 Tax=Rheinheimera riviphila TaxID=1834037 RepID=A0A437QSJ3_9GAMM|nr:GDP-mannose mannosyl hydrolase [Rheinheimera riviphila]RVU37462.1 GDP-mannose mannosyl hydrolase [Rheinheimera riviphila]
MFLEQQLFTQVIQSTPLVAIDLLVENNAGEILLGQRLNRPAQGFWFVPGGRILKNEALASAFARLTQAELGVAIDFQQAQLQGAYDHFYADYVFGEGISTHYVALAYRVRVAVELSQLPQQQHAAYRWLKVCDLLADPTVHQHTKAYFG